MIERTKKASLKMAHEEPTEGSLEELADWYDVHDTSQLETVAVYTAPERRRLVTVALRLPEAQVARLRERAEALGVGYTTYIRMLLTREMERGPLDLSS